MPNMNWFLISCPSLQKSPVWKRWRLPSSDSSLRGPVCVWEGPVFPAASDSPIHHPPALGSFNDRGTGGQEGATSASERGSYRSPPALNDHSLPQLPASDLAGTPEETRNVHWTRIKSVLMHWRFLPRPSHLSLPLPPASLQPPLALLVVCVCFRGPGLSTFQEASRRALLSSPGTATPAAAFLLQDNFILPENTLWVPTGCQALF